MVKHPQIRYLGISAQFLLLALVFVPQLGGLKHWLIGWFIAIGCICSEYYRRDFRIMLLIYGTLTNIFLYWMESLEEQSQVETIFPIMMAIAVLSFMNKYTAAP